MLPHRGTFSKGVYFMKQNINEKKCGKKLLGHALVATAAVVLANAAAGVCVGILNTKKAEKHENQNNIVQSMILGVDKLDVKPDTNNAYYACFMGSMTINVPKPEGKLMTIDITSFMASVKVHVPAGVKVTYEGLINSEIGAPEQEGLPEVRFVVKGKASRIEFLDA